MVVAADNVGNAHVVVVHHDAEVVGRRAVGAGDNQVVECFVGDGDFAFDQSPVHFVTPSKGVFEADDGLNVGRDFGQSFAFFRTPTAIVRRRAFFSAFSRMASSSSLLQ